MSTATLKLNTGASFPALGFGTYSGNPGDTHKATLHALRTGFRHIDTAWGYKNENEVGAAISDFLKENKNVKREDLFVTTKISDTLHKPEDVQWGLEDSLKKLGLEYVDLALVHWPIALVKEDEADNNSGFKKDGDGEAIMDKELTANPRPTWEAMEKLHKSGKAKAIGVSNWTIKGLESLLEYAKVVPAVNQVEIHPLLPNTALLDYCTSKNIHLAAYSPLGGQGADNPLFNDSALASVAKQYNHTIVQILIAWGLKRGYAVLAKSFTPERIEANFKVVELSQEEYDAVGKAVGDRRKRTCPFYASKKIDVWAESE